jgi:NDP-sugar pyrophosphorylase family protein
MPTLNTQVTGIILAGGKGSRLKCLLHGQQKVLYRIHGKPLLQFTIENLEQNIVSRIVLATGRNSEDISEWVNDLHIKPDIVLAPPNEQGIAPAFTSAIQLANTDTVILCNGDEIRIGLDLEQVLRFHESHNAIATMVATRENKLFRHRVLEIDRHNILVKSQLKHPQYKTTPLATGLVNVGFIVAQKDFLLKILPSCETGWNDIIKKLMQTKRLYVFPQESLRYFNVGTTDELAEATSFVANY